MKRREKPFSIILCACLFLLFFFPTDCQADSSETEEKMGFAVESVIPENQVDTTKTYFYLAMEPSQKQTIQVKVRSLQEAPVTIQVAIHDAVSSSVGAIDYAKEKPKLDRSLKDPITRLVKATGGIKEITLKNKEEKTIDFEVTAPETRFSGVKLGSIRFVRKNSEEDKKQKGSGLIPQFARVVAVMLTEDEEAFNHGSELHLKKVGLQLSNGRKVIAARIQNDQPKVLQEMTIQGAVRKKGESKDLDFHKMTDFSVAPTSNFDFEIPLGLEKFKAGTYVFKGKAEGDGRKWEWSKEFTIGNEEADKVNEQSAYQLIVPKWVPGVAFSLVLVLLGLSAYLIQRARKWKNEGT